MDQQVCPGCGLLLAPLDGPTHPYIGANAPCWAIYGEVLAREFGDVRYGRIHRTTVDAYAVQHPGVPERRSIRSVALHLMRLHLTIQHDEGQEKATQLMARLARSKIEFEWLDPPQPNGVLTVMDVVAAEGPEEHVRIARQWAEDIWNAWQPHHARVKGWLDSGLA